MTKENCIKNYKQAVLDKDTEYAKSLLISYKNSFGEEMPADGTVESSSEE